MSDSKDMTDAKSAIGENSIEAVLRLLIFTVYADRVQKPLEMKAVARQLPKLKVFAEGEFFPDTKGLDLLIDKYNAEICHLIDESSLLMEIDAAVRLITSPVLIPMVLAGMKDVANSDGEYHQAEDSIINRASNIWDVPF